MITAMQMVRTGLGVTRVPKILGDKLDGVARIEALPWESYAPLWLLTDADLRKTPRIEAFMQHIGKRVARRRDHYCITN